MPGTFTEFVEKIRNLSLGVPTQEELQGFRLSEFEGKIRIYYAPFDWVNTKAKVVIVGITPGMHSMLTAFQAAATALRQGQTIEESSKRGRRAGSFSNMRAMIAEMLDELGLPAALGIERSEELFTTHYDLLHPTSCIRHPVLVWSKKKGDWVNYTGHSPKLLKWDTAVEYIERLLADELQQIPNALIVPCGKAVDGALQHLSEKGVIDPRRCLIGFPHASRANGHRKRLFEQGKEQLRRELAEWQLKYGGHSLIGGDHART